MSKMSSSSRDMSKFEKEKQKLMQEKCQAMLNDMLRDDDNKYCVDCDAKGPRWASWNLGIFLCIRCAGIHRNLGVHISRVKSVNLDSWTPEQVVTMQQMGNSRARAVYEANLPDNFRRPQTDVALENFIRAKYEHTKYIAQEWVKPAPPRVDWNAEIEEQIRKKKEKKSADATATAILPKFGVTNRTTSPSMAKSINTSSSSKMPVIGKIDVSKVLAPAAGESNNSPAAAQPPPPQQSSASDDLLGLSVPSGTTQQSGSGGSSDPFASPVKSTNSEDDLGGVFTAPADPTSAQQKMTKESILSLYGNLGAGGGGGLGAGPQQIAPNNPFAAHQQQQQQQQHQFGASTNPFPTGGVFSNELLGNGFPGGLMSQNPNLIGGGGGNNISQLQQGMFSMQLGASSQQSNSNNGMMFNSPSSVASPPTNLNMMMMGQQQQQGPTQGIGYFGGVPPHQQQQPQMGVPQHMMPQQNHVMMNQFQMGMFQNGGVATTAPQPQPTTTHSSNPIDLLWK